VSVDEAHHMGAEPVTFLEEMDPKGGVEVEQGRHRFPDRVRLQFNSPDRADRRLQQAGKDHHHLRHQR
jgi:hypothetical protein